MRTGATFRPSMPFWPLLPLAPAAPSLASCTAPAHSLATILSVALRELAAATRTYKGVEPAGIFFDQPFARSLPAGVVMLAVAKVKITSPGESSGATAARL